MASRAFMDRYGKAHYADEETATFRTAYYAIIIKDKKVLLTALPRFDLFEFPGGGQERGEDFRECLQRELYEETGYDFCLSHGKTEIRQVVDFLPMTSGRAANVGFMIRPISFMMPTVMVWSCAKASGKRRKTVVQSG